MRNGIAHAALSVALLITSKRTYFCVKGQKEQHVLTFWAALSCTFVHKLKACTRKQRLFPGVQF